MTAVSLVRIDLREIDAIHVLCNGCKTGVTVPLTREIPSRMTCPGCQNILWSSGSTAVYANHVIDAVRLWRSTLESESSCSLSFSVPRD
jgi:hypothetical protein